MVIRDGNDHVRASPERSFSQKGLLLKQKCLTVKYLLFSASKKYAKLTQELPLQQI